MSINILDSKIYNHISAGEVVDKPASVVKELIENSIDALATEITIDIGSGGMEYISVSDDAVGIDAVDVPKIFLPHATSKIANVEDLENITTLGFRGEAMASIAAVSRVTLLTQTAESDTGSQIDIAAGVIEHTGIIVKAVGTTVVVKNLYFNTPVRRKFLRKPKQEEADITHLVSKYIVAHPEIKIVYKIDGIVHFEHHGENILSAICSVNNYDITQNILPIIYATDDIKIKGYVSKAGFSKPNITYQTTVINGRYVVDEVISKAVYAAYADQLMQRQFPFFVLHLDIDVLDVDINIHPTKLNVKFADPNRIYITVFDAVKEALYNEEQISKFSTMINSTRLTLTDLIEPLPQDSGMSYEEAINAELKEREVYPRYVETTPLQTTATLQSDFFSRGTQSEMKVDDINIAQVYEPCILGVVMNTYVILDNNSELILIDFHAAHERVLYDEYCELCSKRCVAVQPLLIPYNYTVNVVEMQYLFSIFGELKVLGFEFEDFGETHIRVLTVPLLLKNINLKHFVENLLHDIKSYKKKSTYEINKYLMELACKNAVKSGDVLEKSEIKILLSKLDFHKTLLCPHGRPIIYTIPRSTLDKWFKRII